MTELVAADHAEPAVQIPDRPGTEAVGLITDGRQPSRRGSPGCSRLAALEVDTTDAILPEEDPVRRDVVRPCPVSNAVETLRQEAKGSLGLIGRKKILQGLSD